MKKTSKIKAFKILLFVVVISVFIGLTLYLFPLVKNLSTVDGQNEFKKQIKQSNLLGILSLFGLQLAQIFLIIIPGEPIEILAGMCYGTIGGFIIITISSAIITAIILFLVKKFGRKFIYGFCDKEKIDAIEKSAIFQDPLKIEIIMTLLFLIPGTPKDIFVYIAGLLPINPFRFLIISTFARFPSVISSTMAGANFLVGNWKVSLLIYGITFVGVGIFVFIITKSMNNKKIVNNNEKLIRWIINLKKQNLKNSKKYYSFFIIYDINYIA